MARKRDGLSSRWTADTEVAFLQGLRLTGDVTAACAAIGRTPRGTRDRRRRLPEFAAKWQAVLDEARWETLAEDKARRMAAGAIAPDGDEQGEMPNRTRFDGWTPLRQRAFLRVLTETGSFEDACRVVRLSTASARVMRRRHPSFAQACDRALGRSAGMLEQIAYERAVEGWDEPIVHAGRIVGQRRRYSEPLLRLLLQRETAREQARAATAADARSGARARATKGRGVGDSCAGLSGARAEATKVATREETDAVILSRLDVIARHEKAEERERLLAWADEMVRRGLAP